MDILTLLGSYCFPIVACIAMGVYVKKLTENNREDVKQLNKEHSEEMLTFKDEIKEALNNNTLALNRLCEKLNVKKEVSINNGNE